MKIIAKLISFSSMIAMSFSLGTQATTEGLAAMTNKGLTSNLLTINTQSTTLLAQDVGSPEPNTEDPKIPEPEVDLCITEKLCLVNKILKEGVDKEDNYYAYYPSFLGHGFLVIAAGVIIGGTFIGLKLYAINLSNKWIDDLVQKSSAKFSIETVEFPKNVHKSIEENAHCKERLKQQLSEIQVRISRHKEFMLYFYRQHFLSISMASGLALIAGVCVIFVADVGIGDANPALINIFITTASAGLLYQRLPGIFQQELNREANRSLFLKYADLGNTILSYVATGKIRNNTSITNKSFSMKLDADKFVHFIDQELARFNQLPIEFDATKVIKITDLSESINGAFNGDDPDPDEPKPDTPIPVQPKPDTPIPDNTTPAQPKSDNSLDETISGDL